MSVRQDKTELRTSRNGAVLPRDILRPAPDEPVSYQPRGPRLPARPPQIDWARESLRIAIGLLGSLLAIVMLAACLGIAFVSYKMAGVLKEIAKRDFGEATQRFERYGAKFAEMGQAGHQVVVSQPKIVSGVTTHLWVVQPRGSDDRIVYRWKHDLKSNTIEPMTNPALLLDLALGYIQPSDAAQYDFYDPNDKLAQALAYLDFSQISPDQLGQHLPINAALPSSPVGAPLVEPAKARSRWRGQEPAAPQPADTETDPNAPAGNAEAKQGEASDVGGNSPKNGEDQGQGKDGESNPEPPDSDAVPVE